MNRITKTVSFFMPVFYPTGGPFSRRDFKRSDEIRQKLADSGILMEDMKDGSVRWKYK